MRRAPWSPYWAPARDAAGIPEGAACTASATLLIHNCACVKTVRLALGHATRTITLDTYVGECCAPDVPSEGGPVSRSAYWRQSVPS